MRFIGVAIIESFLLLLTLLMVLVVHAGDNGDGAASVASAAYIVIWVRALTFCIRFSTAKRSLLVVDHISRHRVNQMPSLKKVGGRGHCDSIGLVKSLSDQRKTIKEIRAILKRSGYSKSRISQLIPIKRNRRSQASGEQLIQGIPVDQAEHKKKFKSTDKSSADAIE